MHLSADAGLQGAKEGFSKDPGYTRSYVAGRDAEKYSEAESDVVDYECLLNEIALIRNKYLSVIKAYESKNFMLGHLVRLKTAGMEDFSM